jgi:hypothetical protein
VLLWLAPPERVFALHSRHRLNSVGALNGRRTSFGQTEVPDFALRDQFSDGTCHIFHWHLRIYPMLIEEINAVRAEALQRFFGHLPNSIGPAVESEFLAPFLKAKLCSDYHIISDGAQSLPDDFFICERAICLGCVKVGDPSFVGGPQKRHCLATINGRAAMMIETHATEAEARHL